jgi:hypothetical protein
MLFIGNSIYPVDSHRMPSLIFAKPLISIDNLWLGLQSTNEC